MFRTLISLAALAMFTTGGAYTHYLEHSTGALIAGHYADFIVLDPEHVLRGMDVVEENQRKLLSILIHRGHAATVREV